MSLTLRILRDYLKDLENYYSDDTIVMVNSSHWACPVDIVGIGIDAEPISQKEIVSITIQSDGV